MDKFIFNITDRIRVAIEKPNDWQFTPDDYDVFLCIDRKKHLLLRDSIFYDIAPSLKDALMKPPIEYNSEWTKKSLSRRLFEKGEDYFCDRLYVENILFDTAYNGLMLLINTTDGYYIDIARVKFDNEKKYYKQLVRKKVDAKYYNQWMIEFSLLQKCADNEHIEIFGDLGLS